MRRPFTVLVAVLTCVLTTLLKAQENRFTHFGVRPLGMGNAFIAVSDDFNALFYNPAGIARLDTWTGEFFNPTFEISKNTLDFIDDLNTLMKSKTQGFSEILTIIEPQLGRIHHLSFGLTPYFVTKGFGFGIGMDNHLNMVPHSSISIDLDAADETIMPFTYAFNTLEDRLSIGTSIKARVYAGVNDNFGIDTISSFSNTSGSDSSSTKLDDYLKAGYGLGADVGFLFTPVKHMSPTLGLSVLDIGGVVFKKSGAKAGVPSPVPPSVNVGLSLKPLQTNRTYLLLAMDSHMINQPVHYSHKINMGAELGLGSIFKIQSGLNDGFFTCGFQFDVGLLKLRFASYSVDHGPVVGQEKGFVDRRYTVQMKLLI